MYKKDKEYPGLFVIIIPAALDIFKYNKIFISRQIPKAVSWPVFFR